MKKIKPYLSRLHKGVDVILDTEFCIFSIFLKVFNAPAWLLFGYWIVCAAVILAHTFFPKQVEID